MKLRSSNESHSITLSNLLNFLNIRCLVNTAYINYDVLLSNMKSYVGLEYNLTIVTKLKDYLSSSADS